MSYRLPYLRFRTATGLLVGQSFKFWVEAVGSDESSLHTNISLALKSGFDWERFHRSEILLTESDEARLHTVSVTYRPVYATPDGVHPLDFQHVLRFPVLHVQQGESSRCHVFSEDLMNIPPLVVASRKFNLPLVRAHLQQFIGAAGPGSYARQDRLPEFELALLEIQPPKEKSFSYEIPTPVLDRRAGKLRFDKSGQRGKLDNNQVWEREREVAEVQRSLADRRSSILLRGETQTGKSAIIRRALRNLHQKKNAPPVWLIEPTAFVRGTRYLGDWQNVLEEIIAELDATGGILWLSSLPELLTLTGNPNAGPAGYLLTQLQAGKVRIIAEMTPTQERSVQRLFPSFLAAFSKFSIDPLPPPTAREVLSKVGKELTRQTRIKIDAAALDRIHRLMMRFYRFRYFPGKSIDLLLEVLAHARTRHLSRIDDQTVVTAFARSTGVPPSLLDDGLPFQPVEDFLRSRIEGQSEAVEALRRTINVFRAGLNDPGKPIRVLFFAGPTGTGKTECARVLSEYLYGKKERDRRLIRIDMSEYRSVGAAAAFIGQGSDTGKLLREVRRTPFGVILLDEIEKAHPSVLFQLMSVFDEGTLSDPLGRVTDFTNTIIIMTSNLGSRERASMNFDVGQDSDRQRYMGAIDRHLPAEVRNRLDEIVIFQPLEQAEVRGIVRLLLAQLNERRGLAHRNIRLRFTEALVEAIAARGYDEQSGARSIRTVIRRRVEQVLGTYLLRGVDEGTNLLVDWVEEVVVVREDLGEGNG